MICSADLLEPSLYAPKFEDRSQEERERQERCARGDAWRMAKSFVKLNEKDRATFSKGRKFFLDSGKSMHMLNRKNLNSAELETVRVSESPTTAVTANGEVQTKEEATVYVRELNLFVTVKLLEETLAVLSHYTRHIHT